MRALSLLLALLGLCLAAALVAWADVGRVLDAALSAGWEGFGLLALWQGGLYILLGMAWCAVLPGARPGLLIWGRMVRDSATTCLPFSPIGGFVFGARAVTLRGLSWPAAAASTIVDVTGEVLAQGLFALFGLAVLLLRQPDHPLTLPIGLALILAVAGGTVAVRLRRRIGGGLRALSRSVGQRIGGGWFTEAHARLDLLQAELIRLYADPRRLLLGIALHLIGWFMTGTGTWIAYRLLGAPIDLISALAIEALLAAVVAAAFLVPGAAGVQEAGYAGIGAIFGLPPELSLGVSLLRRARDLAVGIPILLAWQVMEVRRLRAAPR